MDLYRDILAQKKAFGTILLAHTSRKNREVKDEHVYSCAITFLLMARRVANTPLPSEAIASKLGTRRRLR